MSTPNDTFKKLKKWTYEDAQVEFWKIFDGNFHIDDSDSGFNVKMGDFEKTTGWKSNELIREAWRREKESGEGKDQ